MTLFLIVVLTVLVAGVLWVCLDISRHVNTLQNRIELAEMRLDVIETGAVRVTGQPVTSAQAQSPTPIVGTTTWIVDYTDNYGTKRTDFIQASTEGSAVGALMARGIKARNIVGIRRA